MTGACRTSVADDGAPMTTVGSGADRDLAAIAAMGRVRTREFRFHRDRDVDFVKHVITRRRLLVIGVFGGTWTIEECGNRDPSGARVGALLHALIAREPIEARPVIRGWLPPGFVPPQVTVTAVGIGAQRRALLVQRCLLTRVDHGGA